MLVLDEADRLLDMGFKSRSVPSCKVVGYWCMEIILCRSEVVKWVEFDGVVRCIKCMHMGTVHVEQTMVTFILVIAKLA